MSNQKKDDLVLRDKKGKPLEIKLSEIEKFDYLLGELIKKLDPLISFWFAIWGDKDE